MIPIKTNLHDHSTILRPESCHDAKYDENIVKPYWKVEEPEQESRAQTRRLKRVGKRPNRVD